MKLAIMQPYFFPYLGYWQLIQAVDIFILFDDVQYIRHGWINRNRILKPAEGWQYIIVPLKSHSRDTVIRQIEVQDDDEWREKILRQMEHYKKIALFYEDTRKIVEQCLSIHTKSITHLNAHALKIICEHLNIKFDYLISSEQHFDYTDVTDAGEWALRISEQLGATEYVNPAGGMELFDYTKFQASNINLSFLKPDLIPYNQKRKNFIDGLSIIDVMMFNSRADIQSMITQYNLCDIS